MTLKDDHERLTKTTGEIVGGSDWGDNNNEGAEHFDYKVGKNGKPFLVGYRKFIIAFVWLALAVFAAIMALMGWAPKRAGTDTIIIWIIGSAGFFCAFFAGGNVLVHYFTKFWNVQTRAQLTQKDETKTVVLEYDSQEDSSWRADEDYEDKIAAAPKP